MSTQQCPVGGFNGFPLTLSQNLFNQWPGTTNTDTVKKEISDLAIATDFAVHWYPTPTTESVGLGIGVVGSSRANIPSATEAERSQYRTVTDLQIFGMNTYLNGTTISYGDAIYTASNVISIVQNRHTNLNITPPSGELAQFEAILAFRIRDKATAISNPSHPHIILLCRPLIYSSTATNSPFWDAVDKAGGPTGTLVSNVKTDISSIFTNDQSILPRMISYRTCIPAKLSNSETTGSVNIYVNVVTEPLRVNLTSSYLTTILSDYKIPLRIADLFGRPTSDSDVYFPKSYGGTGNSVPIFTPNPENLRLISRGSNISDFNTAKQSIIVLYPPELIGTGITSQSPTISSTSKKPYKCYTVDPEKDIVDGQIMIDPLTGDTLESVQRSNTQNGQINIQAGETGVMPGDIEYIITTALTVLGSLGLFIYILFIGLKWREIFNGTSGTPGVSEKSASDTKDEKSGIYQQAIFHTVMGLLSFIGLVLFGIFVQEPAIKNK